MDITTLLNAVTAAVVFGSPLLTALFTHTAMTSRTKNTIAMVVSLAIAVVYEVVTGGVTDWTNIPFAFSVCYGLQQAVYNTLLRAVATHVEANYGVATKGSLLAAGPAVVETEHASDGSEVIVATPLQETPAKG